MKISTIHHRLHILIVILVMVVGVVGVVGLRGITGFSLIRCGLVGPESLRPLAK
jgi:hypothetical protein